MENQIEVPCNLIHGYTNGGEGSCNLSGEYFANSASSFMPWCNTFSSPEYSSNSASNAFQLPYNHGGLLYGHLPSSSSAGIASMMMNNNSNGASVVSTLFGTIHAEIGKMTAQEIMDAKALAASKSHSEAERRRRERINGNLAKLRSMLPNTTKTDKASLLAEVIQHVKELKRQTSEIAEESPLPSEADELSVNPIFKEDGNLIVRATLCCEDRTDLLPDLIKALKALNLRTLKAEITTVGGRFRNVLLIAIENSSGDAEEHQQSITAIQEALKVVVEQSSKQDSCSSSAGGSKRQRTNSLSSSSRCD